MLYMIKQCIVLHPLITIRVFVCVFMRAQKQRKQPVGNSQKWLQVFALIKEQSVIRALSYRVIFKQHFTMLITTRSGIFSHCLKMFSLRPEQFLINQKQNKHLHTCTFLQDDSNLILTIFFFKPWRCCTKKKSVFCNLSITSKNHHTSCTKHAECTFTHVKHVGNRVDIHLVVLMYNSRHAVGSVNPFRRQ